jgi:GT2 family glycosyltransferase
MPLISIIIPMRNAEPFVRAAVESVLKQAGVEIEVIVVDDGSIDRSANIVRGIGDPRVRVIAGPQKGISAAFNAGLAAAIGEFMARCDADDLYPANRLGFQLNFLQQHPEFGAISGAFSTMTHRGKILAAQIADAPGVEVTEELRQGKGRSHVCAYLFRTELLRTLGGCREFFVTAEDVDLQLRLSEITRIWHAPQAAYLYRLHDASITHVQKAGQRKFFEQTARLFQQQRKAGGRDDLDLGRPPAPPAGDETVAVSTKLQIQRILLGEAWSAHRAGAKGQAIKLGARAWMSSPLRISALKSLIALALRPAQSLSPLPEGEGAKGTPAAEGNAARKNHAYHVCIKSRQP